MTCVMQVGELMNPAYCFKQVVSMITRLAEHGLIHCDLNEFNLMVTLPTNLAGPPNNPLWTP
jgi:RIO kinase 2